MTVQEVLQKTAQFFKQKSIESARLDAEIIIAKALGWRRIDLYMKTEYPISDAELNVCREYVRRRATGEPVAYILGEKEFYQHTFIVNPSVLIPRPETEHLVDEGIAFLKAQGERPLRALDFGSGSGCIGISLTKQFPLLKVLGVDISPQAVECAKTNAQSLDVTEQIWFVAQDVSELTLTQVDEQLGGAVDLVVSNPPYISPDDPQVHPHVRQFEPNQALFSGEQGLAHFREWSGIAASILRHGGMMLFEIGCTQANQACEILKNCGNFNSISIIKDYSGHDRVIKAVKEESHG